MSIDAGLLLLRVVVGLLLAGHGAQKLFGWFGGPGLDGFTGWIGSMGLRPPRLWAVLGGVAEFAGGLLLALGLFTPLGSLGILASMLMAIIQVHWPKIWVSEGGLEYPLVNATVAVVLGLVGPGAYSLDTVLGTALPQPVTFWAGLVIVILGIIVALATRAAPAAQRAA